MYIYMLQNSVYVVGYIPI